MFLAVAGIAGISPQQVEREAMVTAGPRPGSAGVFPFRLRGQPIAPPLEGIGRDPHPLVIFSTLVGYVAPLLRGQALLFAQPVAVGRTAVPAHGDHRTVPVRA